MAEGKLKDQAVLLPAVLEAVQLGPAPFATEGQYPILGNALVGGWTRLENIVYY